MKLLTYLFRSRWAKTRSDLADRFGVSPKTIGRDVAALVGAGFPIVSTREKKRDLYAIDPSAQIVIREPFTLPELMALAIARAHFRQTAPGFLFAELTNLLEQVAASLPPQIRRYCEQLEDMADVHVAGAKRKQPDPEIVRRLSEATLDFRTCEVSYLAAGRSRAKRFRVEPHRLVLHAGTLYVVAFNRKYRDYNVLAVDRIQDVTLLDRVFGLPGEAQVRDALSKSFGIFLGEPFQLVARFSPEVKGYIRERTWHPTETMRDLAGGWLEYAAEVSGDVEVLAWVLSFGRDAEIVAPASLRARAAAHLQAAATLYVEDPCPSDG